MGSAAGDAGYTIGVTVFGHTMSVFDDAIVMVALGAILMLLAVWAFSKQE